MDLNQVGRWQLLNFSWCMRKLSSCCCSITMESHGLQWNFSIITTDKTLLCYYFQQFCLNKVAKFLIVYIFFATVFLLLLLSYMYNATHTICYKVIHSTYIWHCLWCPHVNNFFVSNYLPLIIKIIINKNYLSRSWGSSLYRRCTNTEI